jgi:hypothetical protein
MRIRRSSGAARTVTLALATALLVACGGDGGTTDDTDAGAAPPTPEELASSVLLTAEDLGEGWSENSPPDDLLEDGVVTDEAREMLPRIVFCSKASADSSAAAEALEWQAFRQLNLATETDPAYPEEPEPEEPGDPGPRSHDLVFVQQFLLADDAGTVTETYDALAAGMDACRGEVNEYPDGEVGRTVPFSAPPAGEAQTTTRELVKEPGPAGRAGLWDLRMLLARDGEVLVALTVGEVRTPDVPRTLHRDDVDRIVITMAEKLP